MTQLAEENVRKIREDFTILQKHDIAYLDSAATTQVPNCVIDSISEYYTTSHGAVGRSTHSLSAAAEQLYSQSRARVACFIGCEKEEIIFVRSATEGLNLLAHVLKRKMHGKKKIVVTASTHHSNLLPWQQLAKECGMEIEVIPLLRDRYELDYASAQKLIGERVGIVAVEQVSNALGTVHDVDRLLAMAQEAGAISVVDAAQSVGHMPVNVEQLECDYLVFSGHKIYGPAGIGVVYGRGKLLEKLDPWQVGGGMVERATYEDMRWTEKGEKFEAGTPNVPGAIGIAAAINYLEEIGIAWITARNKELVKYMIGELRKIGGVNVLANANEQLGIVSFTVSGIHMHDVASLLNDYGVHVRAGNHCCMPLMNLLGIAGTVRASVGIYTLKKEIDRLMQGIRHAQKVFSIPSR